MKLREALLWVTSTTLAFGWWWSADQAAEATQKVHECADSLYSCADSLAYREQLCTDTSAAAMKRSVQLFQCQLDICEVNGWHPPIEWDEIQQEMLADPEFRELLAQDPETLKAGEDQ